MYLLGVSMIYMYFYLAIYRFAGATNAPSKLTRNLPVASFVIVNIGMTLVVLNLTGT